MSLAGNLKTPGPLCVSTCLGGKTHTKTQAMVLMISVTLTFIFSLVRQSFPLHEGNYGNEFVCVSLANSVVFFLFNFFGGGYKMFHKREL